MFLSTWYLPILVCTVSALNNGVGKLPKLGYDTWNAFQCNYDASLVLAQAEAMKKHGLVDLGYNVLILDDCYAEKRRDKDGQLVADPVKFPDGVPALSRQVNSYGVSLGAYSSNGYYTCAGYPGAYGHETQDLLTFRSWGMYYLKYDNCFSPPDNVTQENVFGRYVRMASAIESLASRMNETPFELGLCEWGVESPWLWASRLGQAWRVDGDLRPWWSSIAHTLTVASHAYFAGNFYGHNDLDMLEVGNNGIGTPPGNLTYDEMKMHFTAWALLKSPLLIGTDLTAATAETLSILTNTDILRINQDPDVGESVHPFRGAGKIEHWTGNSSYGVVFMLVNAQDTVQDMSFNLTESYLIRAGRKYTVYDMWAHTHNGTAVRNVTVAVPPHGVAALLLNDAGPDGIEGSCYHAGYCAFLDGTRVLEDDDDDEGFWPKVGGGSERVLWTQ